MDDALDEDRAWLPKVGPDGRRVAVVIPAWDGNTAQDAWAEAARAVAAARRGQRPADGPGQAAAVPGQGRGVLPAGGPGLQVGAATPPLTAEEAGDPRMEDLHKAHQIMFNWLANRSMTNYESFELEADAMQTDDAMLAKKRFRQADKAVREAARYSEAVRLYDEGFAAWQRVLLAHQDCRARRTADPSAVTQGCRDFRDLDKAQEEAYELSMRYVKLAQDVRQGQLRSATQLLNDLVYHIGRRDHQQPVPVRLRPDRPGRGRGAAAGPGRSGPDRDAGPAARRRSRPSRCPARWTGWPRTAPRGSTRTSSGG